jgi:hypothetical protein
MPADNVWFPADVDADEDTAIHVIDSYFELNADNYEDHALVLAYKHHAKLYDDNASASTPTSPRRSRYSTG